MRLCFYNPHSVANVLGETFLSKLAELFGTNKKSLKKHNRKYEFFLKILNDESYNTAIVVDGIGTSLSTVLNRISWLRNKYGVYKLISSLEIYVWCWLNRINPFKQKIIFNKNKLDQHHDVLLGFAFCTEMFLNDKLVEKSIIKSFTGKKILHATHFYKLTKKVAENVRKTGTTCMVAEADLKKSSYFNKFFDFIENVYILPHVLRERYVKKVDFQDRKNICLALGTFVIESESDKANEDYLNFFKINTLHPMRKIIFENKENLSSLIDCFIYFHNEKRLAETNKSDLYKKNNVFKMLYDLFFLSEGKEYHSVDIVEKYNKYKMFIAPEENIGLPSVNVVEGMACGCAYVGIDHAMHTDLGMVGGQNYIAYDGTLEDLKNKISYYQNHEDELEKIATNGYEFAKKRFSKDRVVKDFWGYLEKITV